MFTIHESESVSTMNISNAGIEKKDSIVDSVTHLEERLIQLHEELEKLYGQLMPLVVPVDMPDPSANCKKIEAGSLLKARIDDCVRLLYSEIEGIQNIRHGLDL